jgi:putative Ca2+/H+ antiporter (TMEM165/GDT1 family)
MDWKLFVSTFFAIFVAELGDKTQLATLSLAASSSSRWVVFAGAGAGLLASSAIAVVLGDAVARVASPALLRRIAGVVFLVMGVVFLATAGRDAGAP